MRPFKKKTEAVPERVVTPRAVQEAEGIRYLFNGSYHFVPNRVLLDYIEETYGKGDK